MKYSPANINTNDYHTVSVIDELPLWSAPFGLELLKKVRIEKNLRILDVGSGLGFPSIEIAMRCGLTTRVYSLDPWKGANNRSAYKSNAAGIQNITIVESPCEKIPFDDNYFDVIVSNNGLNNVAGLNKSLDECTRALKKGGQLVFTANLPDTMKEFYDALKKVLFNEMKAMELAKIEHHIVEKRKSIEFFREILTKKGLEEVSIEEGFFSLRFADAESMMNHFLIRLAFLPSWLEILSNCDSDDILQKTVDLINNQHKGKEIILSVPFAVFEFRKPD